MNLVLSFKSSRKWPTKGRKPHILDIQGISVNRQVQNLKVF